MECGDEKQIIEFGSGCLSHQSTADNPGSTPNAGNHSPAVELLEYLSPRNGRPMPRDTQANDLWHTQIHFAADQVSNMPKQISAYGGALVSPGVVTMDSIDPLKEAVLGRVPTGHAILIYSTNGAEK